MWAALSLVLLAICHQAAAYKQANCAEGRVAIVHLFSWKWTDIARECETHLGPLGYCGVQVSPPNEHVEANNRPWWERYQPVSYKLVSRSGNREEFIDMVQRCNAVNVRIYVDAVINHMAGVDQSGYGSGGSEFNSNEGHFPAVPFTAKNFHSCSQCPACCCINSWMDLDAVRVCRLSGLNDLASESDEVMDIQAAWLNDMIDIGVAGFRVDAAKHMYPEDIEHLQTRIKNLNTAYFSANSRPFIYLEVIDMNQNGEIRGQWYTHLARVTDFRYCAKIKEAAAWLPSIGGVYQPGWGMIASEDAFVFVDNHDNQRGHGAGGDVLSFQNPREYKLANSLMLAYTHGYPRVMSSYYFNGNTDIGPPMHEDESVKDVTTNADGSCGNGWVCEHRWQPIGGMASFAKAVSGTGISNWWSSGNQVAWSRGNKGFYASTNHGSLNVRLQTGLPAGSYCNVIQGCPTNSGCKGDTINVDGSGYAQIVINDKDAPILAIHVEAMAGSGSCVAKGGSVPTPRPEPATTTSSPVTTSSSTSQPGTTTSSSAETGTKRTVVLLYAETWPGQNVFFSGGISHNVRPGCSDDARSSACAIDISHNQLGSSGHYGAYNAWRVNDNKLDWYGAEPGQGQFYGQSASGSPAAWTTNNPGKQGYQELNTWGDHYWMMDVDMNCDQSESGWVELKAVIAGGQGWEYNINQGMCEGSAGGSAPYKSDNHMLRCGYVNVFKINSNECIINNF